jgi:hypothetical protein
VSIALDDGLELVVSEEVDGESGGVELLLEVSLEAADYQSDLDVSVGCEDLS